MTDKVVLSECSTIYLNRDCPRNCSFCSNKKDMKSLDGKQWCQVFDRLQDWFDTKFFLILGIEPLMLPEIDLKTIIDYFKERTDLEYAFYTTAPYSYLAKLDRLFKYGLRNASCGIDVLPKGSDSLHKKAKSAIRIFDLASTYETVTEIHALITISKVNINEVPELIEYLVGRYGTTKKLHIGLNYIEHSDGLDFDFAPERCPEAFSSSDIELLRQFSNVMAEVYKQFGNFIQTPYDYIQNYESAITLDKHCNMVIPCVDADGSLRKCGYRTGNFNSLNILSDLTKQDIRNLYINEVSRCNGCYWAYSYIVANNNELVDYRSKTWKERLE